jgi:hypothetical protein
MPASNVLTGPASSRAACLRAPADGICILRQTASSEKETSLHACEGILSEFQFNEAHVQCKIAHAVMPEGTVLQMFMDGTSIDSVTINGVAKTAVITGRMTSLVRLRFPDGTASTLSESVPYVVNGQDDGMPGAGRDKFSLTVMYDSMAPKSGGLSQAALFGSTAIFAGVLLSGNIVVH